MRCTLDEVCEIAECIHRPDTKLPAGASCRESASCDEGLVCRGGRCLLAQATLRVVDVQARACDLILEAADASRLEGVTFTRRIRGEAVSRAPLMALAFFALDDESLAGAVARLEYRAGQAPQVLQETCYDIDGNVVAGTHVSLQ